MNEFEKRLIEAVDHHRSKAAGLQAVVDATAKPLKVEADALAKASDAVATIEADIAAAAALTAELQKAYNLNPTAATREKLQRALLPNPDAGRLAIAREGHAAVHQRHAKALIDHNLARARHAEHLASHVAYYDAVLPAARRLGAVIVEVLAAVSKANEQRDSSAARRYAIGRELGQEDYTLVRDDPLAGVRNSHTGLSKVMRMLLTDDQWLAFLEEFKLKPPPETHMTPLARTPEGNLVNDVQSD
jgi:hypothetical protein